MGGTFLDSIVLCRNKCRIKKFFCGKQAQGTLQLHTLSPYRVCYIEDHLQRTFNLGGGFVLLCLFQLAYRIPGSEFKPFFDHTFTWRRCPGRLSYAYELHCLKNGQ